MASDASPVAMIRINSLEILQRAPDWNGLERPRVRKQTETSISLYVFHSGHCQSLPHNLGYRANLCARCESALHVYLYSRKLSLPYLSFSSISHPSMGRRSGRSVPLSNNYFKLLTSQPYLSSLGRIGFPS